MLGMVEELDAADHVLVTAVGECVTVVLNRPQKLNAISLGMIRRKILRHAPKLL